MNVSVPLGPCLLFCPFTDGFPRADIHELLSPDLLHQLIKGAFKDHLVTWVNDWVKVEYPAKEANRILDDVDRRIAIAPSFAGLRRFPEGRNFKQWTGDDSKALMKVYIPAIEGHIPDDMVKAVCAFLDFCYIARRDIHDTGSLAAMDDALQRFHNYHEIFLTTGVREDFDLPRLIRAFGAPNGLCSSITESKHIKAVKEPWRRSSRFNALSQMLLTNQRLDKLAAARIDFAKRGMLEGTCLLFVLDQIRRMVPNFEPVHPLLDHDEDHDEYPPLINDCVGGSGHDNVRVVGEDENDEDDDGAIAGPTVEASVELAKTSLRKVYPEDIAIDIKQPDFLNLIQKFIYDQGHLDSASDMSDDATPSTTFHGKITCYPSAVATFHAPSDISGVGGMRHERIRAVDSWRNGPQRHDTIFVNTDSSAEGMHGLDVARVRLFFSFSHHGNKYPCALVDWFSRVGDAPNETTGMWVVEWDNDMTFTSIIHLETIVRAAHLLPVFGEDFISRALTLSDTLDEFSRFYVNKYVDHHSFEIAF
ncbi:hypothetical protein EDB85DRAFT_1895162 [Lactarius pseudohatsudake]|nr:hypothetical protein EDB85DRAFT_1895162 [Lactarius pseudohatsudake]